VVLADKLLLVNECQFCNEGKKNLELLWFLYNPAVDFTLERAGATSFLQQISLTVTWINFCWQIKEHWKHVFVAERLFLQTVIKFIFCRFRAIGLFH
jgi:hypothetical protein